MKMKMKSKGDSGLPLAERVYLNVIPPLKYSKKIAVQGAFVSEKWSMGKSIDSIVSSLGKWKYNRSA